MPIVFDSDQAALRIPLGHQLPDTEAPSLGATIMNSFEQNTVVESVDLLTRPFYKSVKDYNPADDDQYKGTRFERDHWYSFVGSRSPDETSDIISRIKREENRQRISAAAGYYGVMADLGAGLFDPINIIPIARMYGATIKTPLKLAATGATAAAGQEAVHQVAQETRTWEDSYHAVVTSAALGFRLGATVQSGIAFNYLMKYGLRTDSEIAKMEEVAAGRAANHARPSASDAASPAIPDAAGALLGGRVFLK